jgi:predicted ATP-grasp superfamily ATP-dependent carboligase
VRTVAPLRDRPRYPASVPAAEVVELLIAKDRLAGLLRELGVPHPRTVEIGHPADLDSVGDEELRSFFLKPRDSPAFHRRFGTKGFPIESRAQAQERIALARRASIDLVAQELIVGSPGSHVFLDGFVDRTGATRAVFARRRVRMWPPGLGNSTQTVTVPLSDVADALGSLRRLLEAVEYRGPFDVEFVHDPRDDRFKMLDINVRPWWQVALAAHCGVDVVAMLYDDALGRRVPDASGYRVGARWINPIQDLRALRSGIRADVSRGTDAWHKAALGMFRWDDPRPGAAEVARVVRSRSSTGRATLPP